MPTSPHPKIAAIVAVLVAIGVAVQSLIDGNPATNPDWSALGTVAILAWGVFSARQNNQSSEDVGLKPVVPPKP